MDSALLIMSTMFGVVDGQFVYVYIFQGVAIKSVAILLFLLLITWGLPNTAQWVGYSIDDKVAGSVVDDHDKTRIDDFGFVKKYLSFKPSKSWAVFSAMLFIVSVLNLTRVSEFIYFNF